MESEATIISQNTEFAPKVEVVLNNEVYSLNRSDEIVHASPESGIQAIDRINSAVPATSSAVQNPGSTTNNIVLNEAEIPKGFVIAHKSLTFPLTDLNGQTVALGHFGNADDIASTAGLLGAYRFLPQEPVRTDEVVRDGAVEVQVLDRSRLVVPSEGLSVGGQESMGNPAVVTATDNGILTEFNVQTSALTQPHYMDAMTTAPQMQVLVENPDQAHLVSGVHTERDHVEHCVLTKLEQYSPGTAYTIEVVTPEKVQHNTVTADHMKKKGGWPKGRKRKKELMKPPVAPVTAYVFYMTEKRQEIRDSRPDLDFAQVTRVLGNSWSTMDTAAKQKYIDKAAEDKKRYIAELRAYQSSDAYQTFLKNKRLKEGKPPVEELCSDNPLDDDSLHCTVCDVYFSSAHNKREHVFGRQHLLSLTNEFRRELIEKEEEEERQTNAEYERKVLELRLGEVGATGTGMDLEESASPDGGPRSCYCSSGSVDAFVQHYVEKNNERDIELKSLRNEVQRLQIKYNGYLQQLEQLKDKESKCIEEWTNLKSTEVSLSTQIDGLKMVPNLFGLVNF